MLTEIKQLKNEERWLKRKRVTERQRDMDATVKLANVIVFI